MNNGSKIDAATPGLSLTPTKVIFASFFVNETPLIIFFADTFFLFVIKDPEIFINRKKQTVKLHFDMYHGYGVLENAIKLMKKKDRVEFDKYVNSNVMINPHIMFISKKKIINEWFNDLFKWLFKCEKVFGLKKLKGYDQERLYAFLAERYMSYWFKKKTNYLEWPWT